MLSAAYGESCLAWVMSGFFIPRKSFHTKCASSSAPTQLHTIVKMMYGMSNILIDKGALEKTSWRLVGFVGFMRRLVFTTLANCG